MSPWHTFFDLLATIPGWLWQFVAIAAGIAVAAHLETRRRS